MVKPYLEKFNYFLLFAIAATLPFEFHAKINTLFIILLVVNWLLQWKFSFGNTLLKLFVLFYLLHIIGILFSSNTHQAFFELEKKLSFLIFPLVLSGIPALSSKQFKNILIGFVVSCFVASVICLGYATYQYVTNHTSEYFFYHPLAETVGMHGNYLAMYVCICLFIIFYLYLYGGYGLNGAQKTGVYFIIGYFIGFLFLLSARSQIVAFGLITFSGVILYYYERKKLWKAAVVIGLLSFFFVVLVLINPLNRDRLKEAINYNSEYGIEKMWGGRAERFLMWDCSLDIIHENLWLGVGTGDAQDELQECYKARDYYPLLHYATAQYNTHNQYFQSAMDLGILGLLVFLLCLGVPAYQAFKRKNYLFLAFIGLFAIACVTESMLEANKGIVFFTFFSSFLGLQWRQDS